MNDSRSSRFFPATKLLTRQYGYKMQKKNNPGHFLLFFPPNSKKSRRWTVLLISAMLLGATGWLTTGCEEKKDWSEFAGASTSTGGGEARNNADIAGTWSLTNTEHTWYIHFAADGNWKITNDAADTVRRVYGTYKLSGSKLQGPMNNPGTGTGEIVATFKGNRIDLQFIEHWHTPHKKVNYSGKKL